MTAPLPDLTGHSAADAQVTGAGEVTHAPDGHKPTATQDNGAVGALSPATDQSPRDTHGGRVGGGPTSCTGHWGTGTQNVSAGAGPEFRRDQGQFDAQDKHVATASTPEPATLEAAPQQATPVRDLPRHRDAKPATNPNVGVRPGGPQNRPAAAKVLAAPIDAPPPLAGPVVHPAPGLHPPPDNSAPPRNDHPDATDRAIPNEQACPGDPRDRPAAAKHGSAPRDQAPLLADPFLALAADVLNDLETVRIANENRLRQLTRDETDADGMERGFGLTLDHPDVAQLAALVDDLRAAEHRAELNLRRVLRKHPLGPWVKAQRGVGEKQGARLLAAVGDPYWNTLHQRPRTVSELWAYCGYRPGQRRRKGVKDNWSGTAKMRAFMVAEACVKQLCTPCATIKSEQGEYLATTHHTDCRCSPYRVAYDGSRAKYAGTVHPEDCTRCGPTGAPAPAGSPRSAKHQHQAAIRLATKALLRDLWREAKRLHDNAPRRAGAR